MGEEEMRMRRRRRRRGRRGRDYGSSNDDDDDDEYDQEAEEAEEAEERVLEWEDGLPSADDLTPLSQHLIPPQLASAFSIKPEPLSTMLDVNRATHKTLSTLLLLLLHTTTTTTTTTTRRHGSLPLPSTTITTKTNNHNNHNNNLIIKPPFSFSSSASSTSFFFFKKDDVNQSHEGDEEDPMVVEGDHDDVQDEDEDPPPGTPPTKDKDGSETRVLLPEEVEEVEEVEEEEINNNTNNNTNITEEVDSGFRTENSNDDHSAARTLKRPRLVWTPQLHKRFVDVVAHLGIKNAVPKTIMQLMNVEGLTRENVASHLQKYRLYLKRMQGLSNEGPSSSDPLFASTPVPHSLHEPTTSGSTSGKQQHISHPQPPPPPPMPYGGNMLPMPVLGHGFGNPAGAAAAAAAAAYQGFEFHSYGMFRDQQREYWSGNRFGPTVSYPKASKR